MLSHGLGLRGWHSAFYSKLSDPVCAHDRKQRARCHPRPSLEGQGGRMDVACRSRTCTGGKGCAVRFAAHKLRQHKFIHERLHARRFLAPPRANAQHPRPRLSSRGASIPGACRAARRGHREGAFRPPQLGVDLLQLPEKLLHCRVVLPTHQTLPKITGCRLPCGTLLIALYFL